MTDRTDAILSPEFAGVPDWQVADALNARTTTADGDVPTKEIRRYLVLNGLIGGIEETSRGTGALARACTAVLRALDPGAFTDLDFDDPAVVAQISAMCDALVAGGLISEQNKTDILAMGTRTVAMWNPPFTAREVGLARGGI